MQTILSNRYNFFPGKKTMSDILVVMPPLTTDDSVIFAKNSDRPPKEVQEVVYFPSAVHDSGSKVHVSEHLSVLYLCQILNVILITILDMLKGKMIYMCLPQLFLALFFSPFPAMFF